MDKAIGRQPSQALIKRLDAAQAIAKEAGELALAYFKDLSALTIENKAGSHDVVSVADREAEILIRRRIKQLFPEDGILGEELGYDNEGALYTWVVDPIDGTQMFLSGIQSWSVSIAIVKDGQPVLGMVFDPNHDECYASAEGMGATLNGKILNMDNEASFANGMVGVGTNRPGTQHAIVSLIDFVLENDGQVIRTGSGALMLAQVAASKLIGYYEERMFPWDCLAGICLINEAGGAVNDYEFSERSSQEGGLVLAGTRTVVRKLKEQKMC